EVVERVRRIEADVKAIRAKTDLLDQIKAKVDVMPPSSALVPSPMRGQPAVIPPGAGQSLPVPDRRTAPVQPSRNAYAVIDQNLSELGTRAAKPAIGAMSRATPAADPVVENRGTATVRGR